MIHAFILDHPSCNTQKLHLLCSIDWPWCGAHTELSKKASVGFVQWQFRNSRVLAIYFFLLTICYRLTVTVKVLHWKVSKWAFLQMLLFIQWTRKSNQYLVTSRTSVSRICWHLVESVLFILCNISCTIGFHTAPVALDHCKVALLDVCAVCSTGVW